MVLLRSIKGTLTTLTVVSFFLMSAAILMISVSEHEDLYRSSVMDDLDSLSENMSNDLVGVLATSTDEIALTTMLLRLDAYENIVLASVYDQDWKIQQLYMGKSDSFNLENPMSQIPKDIKNLSNGVHDIGGTLISIKRIGDVSFPLGYLLIIKDAQSALDNSTSSLFLNLLPFVVVILTIVLYALIRLQGELLIPLNQLADIAKFVKDTKDYSVRFETGGKLEVSRLSNDFNRMMETIEQETNKNNEQTIRLKDQQKEMERLANFDSLTGLPNRQFFMQTLRLSLARAEREKHNVALMYLDLDGFKDINDNYGHEVGDSLLVLVTEKLKGFTRDGDVLSRLGGDEFLILLYNDPNQYVLNDIAKRIVDGLNQPINIKGWEVNISVSVGIAKANDSNFNLSDLVANADIAMYRSKTLGKGTFTSFLPEMMEDNKRKLQIANALLPAIAANEFTIHYQGKVDKNEEIVGYEALIRWVSEELGFVSPAEFIPIAENSGKINSLTEWVIETSIRDVNRLIEHHNDELVLSINLSAHDIKKMSLIDKIEGLFKKYKVNPKNIEFEVTESAYLENFDEANLFLNKINDIGCTIALDDFGTGYSSLGYLTKIPIDTLKIDKQFVDELEISNRSTLITMTIIEMAKHLNLKICAEGVETQEQKIFLFNNNCHQLQGYLFAKPMPIELILKTTS